MTNSSTHDDRINVTSTPTKQTPSAPSPRWLPAGSLRPDPEALAFGCIDNDEQSIAIVEAWRFRATRASRVICIDREDFIALRERVEPVKIPGKKHFAPKPDSSRNKEEATPGKAGRVLSPTWDQIFAPGASASQKEKAVEKLLDDTMTSFVAGEDTSWDQLWEALNIFGEYRSQAPRQQTMRRLVREEDLRQDFVLHIFKQIRDGKYKGRSYFSHWVKVVHCNFVRSALTNVTKERNQTVGLAPRMISEDAEAETGYEKGYVFCDGMSMPMLQAAQRQAQGVTVAMKGLNEADRAHAGSLMTGLQQKEAALLSKESVVTARKREQRIRAALQAAGYGGKPTPPTGGVVDLQGCADPDGDERGCTSCHIRGRRAAWTAEELSELLSLSQKHLYKLAKSGRMPSYPVGGAVRFDPRATADWLEGKAVA